MSAAAERELIYRCLAAAAAGKTKLQEINEPYPYDETQQQFFVRAAELILMAQGAARRQQRPKGDRGPRGAAPKSENRTPENEKGKAPVVRFRLGKINRRHGVASEKNGEGDGDDAA